MNRQEIEKTERNELMAMLKGISTQATPGPVAKQTAERIVMRLRMLDGKITQVQYEAYWANFKAV